MPIETTAVPQTDDERTLLQFLDDWKHGDADRLVPYFTEDVVYHNMPLDPLNGHDKIRVAIEGWFSLFAMRIATSLVATRGDTIFTERVDLFEVPGRQGELELPIVGVTEMRDGLIAAWREYYDLRGFEVESGLVLTDG